MSDAKPTGDYADQMLEPDGWVEVDEQAPNGRAQVVAQSLSGPTVGGMRIRRARRDFGASIAPADHLS